MQNDSGVPDAAEPNQDYEVYSETLAAEKKAEEAKPNTDHPPEPESQEETPKEEGEGSSEAPKKGKGGWHRKLDRKDAEIAAKDAQIAELMAKLQPDVGGTKPPENKEPVEADFESAIDYLKAHNKWSADEAVNAAEAKRAEKAQEQTAKIEYEKKSKDYESRADTLLEEHPDFYERAAELYRSGYVTPQLENAVLDSPIGEQVTLYLMNNPVELNIIRSLDEAHTYRAIALLEARLSDQKQTAVRQTSAAPPIKPIKSQSVSIDDSLDTDNYEKFVSQRNKQVKERGGW